MVNKQVFERTLTVVAANIALVAFTTAVVVYYPHPGNVVAYAGCIAGITYICIMPIAVHLSILKQDRMLTTFSTVMHIA